MKETKLNTNVANLVNQILNKKKASVNSLIDQIVLGPVTYEIWKSSNDKFKVMKSVLPYAKTAESDFFKEMNSEEVIRELVARLKKEGE